MRVWSALPSESRSSLAMIAGLLVAVVLGSGVVVRAKEIQGGARFYSQMGQDIWVSETVFPGVNNGFFLDVGSGDGTYMSNTKALEQKGWTGICIDPFPRNMQDRSCQMFKDVVFSTAGARVQFWAADDWGGIIDETFGLTKDRMQQSQDRQAQTVEFTTVTLADILDRAQAPRFIHYVSLDIEGGELHALEGFPFDKYQIGALTVEHNYQEPKRSDIRALMESHGYKRVHTLERDDCYVPANPSSVTLLGAEDPAAVFDSLKNRAVQGDAVAQNALGGMYEDGNGVPQNYAQALKWYRLAATQGYAVAQLNLGYMYQKGNGVLQDYVQAHKWFDLAAATFPTPSERDRAVQARDGVAAKMTPAQVAEAQKLAREWQKQ